MESSSQVALITGGASGLGKAVALELARRGWSIFMQHAEADGGDVISACQAAGAQATDEAQYHAAQADLGSADDRDRLVEQVLDDMGRLDMLVNAAPAPSASGDLLELDEADYSAIMQHSVRATLFLTQLVAREMVRLVEAGDIENPKIVTLNSIAAYTTSAGQAGNCIASAAMGMLTQLFADRLGEYGINVYEIRTGIIATAAGDAAHARYDELISRGLTPIRRWGRPGDVARAVAAIGDDLLPFSTGEVINVDGGFHLRRL